MRGTHLQVSLPTFLKHSSSKVRIYGLWIYDSKRKVRIIPGFFLLPSFHYNTFLEHIICIIEYISFNQKDINLKEML